MCLTVSDFMASFSCIKTDKQDTSFIEYFPYCDMDTYIKDVSGDWICCKDINHSFGMYTM